MRAFARVLTAAVVAVLTFAAGPAVGQEDPEQQIRQTLQERLGISDVQSVQPSPVEGLYEVVVQNQVLYITPDARYLIQGQVLDTRDRTNLTAQRKRELQTSQVAWSDLPLEHGVTWGDSEGREIAVFSDPMCPHCKRVHEHLQAMDGVQVHELMMPLEALHEGATTKARRILCADDPAQALHDNFAGEGVSGSADCEAAESVSTTLEYAQNQGWSGTPVLVRRDGTVQVGAPESREELQSWLEQSGG